MMLQIEQLQLSDIPDDSRRNNNNFSADTKGGQHIFTNHKKHG